MTLCQPLPERMRPTELASFVGQTHLSERLQTLMAAPRLPSLLLFGPPGCGKSTLALLARARGGVVLRLSAPEAGLQQLRRRLSGVDVLVLDELHRFSKAQQDFFLPLLESGELTMIATTTENPSFSVTRQLLSRLHVLRLRPLGRQELTDLGKRGAGELGADLPDEVLDFLATAAHGDARTMLNLVEHAASLPEDKRSLDHVRAVLPEILSRHDKDGDSHYEYASALIKSIRGSDPDAALYYLACLLEGGEDPRFICRRLILSASEDVGLADPAALPLAVACQQAVEFVGMPEGYIPLAPSIWRWRARAIPPTRLMRMPRAKSKSTGRRRSPCTCATPRQSSSANGVTARIINTRTIFPMPGWNRNICPPRSKRGFFTSPKTTAKNPA